MEQKSMQINIIDISSTEFNRGSFCYAPYLCYNGLVESGEKVNLIESFQPENLDKIPDADVQLVTLWSYPQIECAALLAQFLPFTYGKDNVFFAGYSPLIYKLGFRHVENLLGYDPLQQKEFLISAMRSYPRHYKDFQRLLLSDCDMHLKHLEKDEKVYPLFTSYGCPNGCAFCPSTKNCGKTRISLPIENVLSLIDECVEQGVRSIHFTDEDFFYDTKRAGEILNYVREAYEPGTFHFIALGSAKAVWDFIQEHGTTLLGDSGMEVIEIGFESGSENLAQSMGLGKSLQHCEQLAKIQNTLPCNIFWLVQTFFPGETIKSLGETGSFMRLYGFEMDEVVGRLRTNGTKGGLGQFFQPYYGVPIYKVLDKKGMFLTDRPIRLIPSFLPNTFLDSVITDIVSSRLESALPYLKLYNVTTDKILPENLKTGKTLRHYIANVDMYTQIQLAIGFAILARMGVIK